MSQSSKPTRLEDSYRVLEYLYAKIPGTKGCMECISKPVENGGCGAWCCLEQNPQVLYVEFRNSWNNIQHNWSDRQVFELIERCLRAYIFKESRQGCVFWDSESKLCSQHETRPYNCRIYGITPEEEWKPRYERLKVIYTDTRDQCNLISTVDDIAFTKKQLDEIWNLLKQAERNLGIKEEDIHDDYGGSYRHYYEHVLLHFMGDEGMEMLSHTRLHGDKKQQEAVIQHALNGAKSFMEKRNES